METLPKTDLAGLNDRPSLPTRMGKKLAASSTRTARPRNRWKASYAVYKLMKIPSPIVVAGFTFNCPPAGEYGTLRFGLFRKMNGDVSLTC